MVLFQTIINSPSMAVSFLNIASNDFLKEAIDGSL